MAESNSQQREEDEEREVKQGRKEPNRKMTPNIARIALVISLSLNIFVLACLAMYGTWLATPWLNSFWRGVSSLLVWIISFGIGALAFWKLILSMSGTGARVAS